MMDNSGTFASSGGEQWSKDNSFHLLFHPL